MIFKTISFFNYKGYKGLNKIDVFVDINSKKNIVLIGAENGAGKTSILDGIKLDLYGIRSGLISGESYEQFARETINVASYREGNRKFYIELELVDESSGAIGDTLTIRREWILNSDGRLKKEELKIDRNNIEIFRTDDEQDKSDFLESIFPIGVSQFFLFDGEKIQNLAENKGHDSAITDGIRDILNISIYQTAKIDLELFEVSERKKQANLKDSDIIQAQLELAKIDEEIKRCQCQLDMDEQQLVNLQTCRDTLKSWLRYHGVSSATGQKDNIKLELENQIEAREEARNCILEYSKNTLAHQITFPIIREVKEQLKQEQIYRNNLVQYQKNDEMFNEMQKCLECISIQPLLTIYQKSEISHLQRGVWATKANRPVYKMEEVLHDISNYEIEELSNEIDNAYCNLLKEEVVILSVINAYEQSCDRIDILTHEIKKIPTDDNISSKERDLEEVEEKINDLKYSIFKSQDTLNELNIKLNIIQKNLKTL